MKTFRGFYWIIIGITFFGCMGSKTQNPSSDEETRQIGAQVWITKNLDVLAFQNGDTIKQATTIKQWLEAAQKKEPAWCYFNNDPEMGKKYGKLYNCYAVMDPRELAPAGYHIPSEEEWNVLYDFLDQQNESKKKEFFAFWKQLSGYRNHNGDFLDLGKSGNYWSSTPYLNNLSWNSSFTEHDNTMQMHIQASDCPIGFSVRCVKN